MMGSVIKNYYAKKQGIDPADVYVVSVMPCTAKKFEALRPELAHAGVTDVDAVLTTRQFARLIRIFGIDFATLPEEEFDKPFGASTGSGDIFAASGGVMESALRSAYYLLTGKDLEQLEFEPVRGMTGVKEAADHDRRPGAEGRGGEPARQRPADRRPRDGGRLAVGVHRGDGVPGRLRGRRRPALRLRSREGAEADQGDLRAGEAARTCGCPTRTRP